MVFANFVCYFRYLYLIKEADKESLADYVSRINLICYFRDLVASSPSCRTILVLERG